MKLIRRLFRKIDAALFGNVIREIQENRMLIARSLIRQLHDSGRSLSLHDAEFRVFSQWGEDGIIQYLIRHVAIENSTFVEFGASNYLESNTRFLLVNNNWSGLVIDGDPENVSFIKSDPDYWRHGLKAECSFITRDNINGLLESNGISGDIGLLSIDIDGNDYWVWKAITAISPRIVVLEYNSRFGSERAVTIPYDENFARQKAHHSLIYYGASLKALVNLSRKKGYSFVGCNSNGVNAFFVRSDLLAGPLQELTAEAGYVAGKFREARDANGELSFINAEEEREILDTLPLIELPD